MKKLVNDPLLVVEEMIEGLLFADSRLTRIDGHNVVLRRDHREFAQSGKVALVSGGGAGHEPAHAGYVGEGMLTAAVVGAVFTSPSVDAVLAAIRAVAGPSGVLLIIKNYTGDRLNFSLAAEIARSEGIATDMVIVRDDVALDEDSAVGARGIAGTVLVHKIAGAAAAAGLPLAEVRAQAAAAADAVVSMGLGLGSCIVPAAGKCGFELGPDEVEFGLGIHGESGARRGPVASADAMIDPLLERLIERADLQPSDCVALLVNNLGGTAVQELSIVARRALVRLRESGVAVRASLIGSYLTALEMPGVSISLMKLDKRRLKWLLAPCSAGAWTAPTEPATGLQAVSLPAESGAAGPPGPGWSERDGDRFAKAVKSVCASLGAAEPELTELDSTVGDGDMGISLARGARAIEEWLPRLDASRPSAALREISDILRRSLGGTSGPLYAAFVLRAGNELGQWPDPARSDAWAAAFRAGCDAVRDLGGGEAGDRTMLDALIPAAAAIERASGQGDSVDALLEAAIGAADAGVEATRTMAPRLGRSAYVGGRAVGHVDPGARAVAIWLRAIAAAL
jgi:dihydroxyacetone kinase